MTDTSEGDLGPYTPAARQVVESAPMHAAALGHDAADTGHVLLGIVSGGGTGLAGMILRELLVEPAEVQRGIEERLQLGDRLVSSRVSFTAAARRSLNLALRENPVAGPQRIGTDALVLGLLAEGGFATEVLAAHGVTTERFRAARRQVSSRQCYGCAEGAQREMPIEVVSPTFPDELNQLIGRVAELRHAKETAVDAGDWEQAAERRTQEKDALRQAITQVDEQTAKAHLGSAINEIMWLREQVAEHAGLLHRRHGAGQRQQ